MAAEAKCALVFDNHRIIIACMRIMAPQAHALGEWRVNAIIAWHFHEACVALLAQFRPWRFQQFRFARSMGVMAVVALTVPNGFMDRVFLKGLFEIEMAGEACLINSILEQVHIHDSMGVMAGCTLLLDKRRMLVFRFQGCFRFRMARKAQINVFFDKKMVVLCSMRHMAGKASPVAGDGRMNFHAPGLLVGVTAETECIPPFSQKLRV